MKRRAKGKVYLIGAGPGDPELITMKGARRLQECDVVLIDDLANPELLKFARADARVIDVGKRHMGSKRTAQKDIVQQMIALASQGLTIGRLKGGDPFVFGRGGEELLALQEADIDCEVVSGITAGIAVPATLGIALTNRLIASGVTFVTGHCCTENELDWQAIAASKTTLVIYMGMTRVAEIAATLCQHGMKAETPVVIIENGTLPNQRSVFTYLSNMAQAVELNQMVSPSIIVVGDVVATATAADPLRQSKIDPTLQRATLGGLK